MTHSFVRSIVGSLFEKSLGKSNVSCSLSAAHKCQSYEEINLSCGMDNIRDFVWLRIKLDPMKLQASSPHTNHPSNALQWPPPPSFQYSQPVYFEGMLGMELN